MSRDNPRGLVPIRTVIGEMTREMILDREWARLRARGERVFVSQVGNPNMRYQFFLDEVRGLNE